MYKSALKNNKQIFLQNDYDLIKVLSLFLKQIVKIYSNHLSSGLIL